MSLAHILRLAMPPAAKVVLAVLELEAATGNGSPSIPELMAASALARSTVLECLAQLEAGGHLTRERSPSKRTRYALHVQTADRPQPAPSIDRTVRKPAPKPVRVAAGGRVH